MALGTAGSGVTTAGVVMMGLVLAALAWIPLLAPATPEVEVAPVLAAAPAPVPATPLSRHSLPALSSLPVPLLRPAARPTDFVVRPMIFDYGAWLTRRPSQGLATTVDPD